jgi:enoyl-CoA hydratase/carnithine racemase
MRALEAPLRRGLADLALALSGVALPRGVRGRAHDFAEGVAAFFAKRPPTFRDR